MKKSLPVALVELGGMLIYLAFLQHLVTTYLWRMPEESWARRALQLLRSYRDQRERDRLAVWLRPESSIEPSV